MDKSESLFEDFDVEPLDESKLAGSSLVEAILNDKQDGPAMTLDEFKAWLTTL